MNWKNNYKKRNKRISLINKIKFLNLKKIINNYSKLLLWLIIVLIFYSIINRHLFNHENINDSREQNQKQIKKLNLSELYELKKLKHNDVRIWVLNNTKQIGLAAKVRDCLEKGYYIGKEHIKGDYNIFKQDNFDKNDQFDMGYMDKTKTKIFVHVDTINNPNFEEHLKEFLLFTGYNKNVVKYNYQKKLYQERDITIILGEDWDESSNLVQCNNPIN